MQRFETKYDLLNAAYKDERLKKGSISLLQYLVYKANKEKCFPAVETIAKALNVCKRTVQYNMRKLERTGYIIRTDRWYNHQQLTNQYVFNLGVMEDVKSSIKYSDNEKGSILSQFAEQNEEACFVKMKEITKVYEMCLTGREKLLLINLIHRANRSGVTYRTEKQIMNDIGVENRTLIKVLKQLRRKNLIMVRTVYIKGREVYVIKLTGKVWMNYKKEVSAQVASDGTGHVAQKVSADQNQEISNLRKNRQKSRGDSRIRQNSFWNRILDKAKGVIQSGFAKIRFILRL